MMDHKSMLLYLRITVLLKYLYVSQFLELKLFWICCRIEKHLSPVDMVSHRRSDVKLQIKHMNC